MERVIDIKGLTKSFKDKKAVADVTFTINRGEIVAILGPNGAGKTTTMLMMLGLLSPTKGDVKIFGVDAKSKNVREKIGVMLQEVSIMDGLKVKEIISLIRNYYPNPYSLDYLIQITGLNEDDLKKRTEKLSGGQKRRVGFALALAGNPDILFFDEPTVGMDISARKIFWETVKELAKQGKTIIFSTHYLQEADDVANRILLFKEGTIIADGTPDEIKKKLSKQSVSFITKGVIPRKMFLEHPFVTDMYDKDGRIYIMTEDTDLVLARIFDLKLNVKDIRVEKGRLEEAFEQLTSEHKEVI
ncbi:ABC transporter ATP-binding protein [Lederbergia wuyishanensis]|uniref:ABC-2 type transport system ATP-binding protein n=1 Tax=Lederbergia wuyishanensis TaxID=1347903 RepID=A0ABU0D635_9BACI|nr:ABC transporter ATP-binding protein [Lederbergia wuyishanensis]MCJ8008411.1 ABC transporter ATP-binding protein [Lederbergia wuyishanensis]MDQ0343828.1 ABC-2 type transport system ATP-binding protein [Lederbergia wuyishanensis]